MDYTCIFCQIRAFEKLLGKQPISKEQKNQAAQDFLEYITTVNGESAPEVSREMHAKIRALLNDSDPYRAEKDRMNQYLLDHYGKFAHWVKSSDDPFNTAMRMAIAGNIIDFGPGHEFDIDETLQKVLNSPMAYDHSEELKKDLETAEMVLYLGDNSGEIVLDKLFIQTIGHPDLYFAVRGKPVINDATKREANVVGMHDVARVVSNGYDAPSTLIDKAPSRFQELFYDADVVISKGMGNLEGLLNTERQKVYFLLMVKCDFIGQKINASKGDIVALKNDLMPR